MNIKLLWNFIRIYYKPVKWSFLLMFVVIPVIATLQALIPWFFSQIINLLQTGSHTSAVEEKILELFIVLSFATLLSFILFIWGSFYLQNKMIFPITNKIRLDSFGKALEQHSHFWNKFPAGMVWSKIEQLRRTFAAHSSIYDFLFGTYMSVIKIFIIVGLISSLYIPLGLIILFSICGLALLFAKLSNNTFRASAQQQKFLHKICGKVVNMLNNHLILKIFGRIEQETNLLHKDYQTIAKAMQKNSGLRNINHLLLDVAIVLVESFIIIYTVYLWKEHILQVGDVVYILMTIKGMGELSSTLVETIMFWRSQLFKAQKDIETLKIKPNILDVDKAKKLHITDGKIEIRHLNFAYTKNKEVLHDINLTIHPHEKVGIIGLSGGGKTTLLHLVQRLLNVPKNSIFIDGQDISLVSQQSLHQTLGFVPQDTSLFHREISENIHYGNLRAQKTQVIASAKQGYVDEFVQEFPKKYRTLVGEKGVKLSGGQRQRVGISRAFLKDAPILLLDEATSALDSLSEKYVQKSLKKLIKNKTVLVVAHRISTLKNMDRIIVLENGRIVEEGTPQNLLSQKGEYAKIWQLQAF